MDEQLSVTIWPGLPVPVPELPRYPEATLDGEMIWLPNWNENYGEMAPPPPELYLRQARQIDLLDPEALLHFVQTVGGVPYAFEDRDLFPTPDEWQQNSKRARAIFAANRGRRYEKPQLVAGRGWGVHVEEVAYRLRLLDILGRHAVAYRNGDYLAPVWQEAHAKPYRLPQTEKEAWEEFGYHANQALQPFHARVQVLTDDGREMGHWATFLEVGVLQIVNDLADEVDYLTCPNCGQVFARQVGGSSHYSRRTGVTYCTPQCATAARVKAYRARKRAERAN
jgi:predicted RNA-binding Zn-ribbon protein involved in translation (DUF1610 family)